MHSSWKDSIYRQREELARMLKEPLARSAEHCTSGWQSRGSLNRTLIGLFSGIPYCTYLYAVDPNGIQVSDNIGRGAVVLEHWGRDRSQRPYMCEPVPDWGFLLSDAYISLNEHRPSLTALQAVRAEGRLLGYLGADFDLRDLPVTSDLYDEPTDWQQFKGDPAIRSGLFQQTRAESPMDRCLDQALSILQELLTERGAFQCQLHFSSSQAVIWLLDDPYRYRILDQDALNDPDICLLYPKRAYPEHACVADALIGPTLDVLANLRLSDDTLYLRAASINIFNGKVSVTFSCDGTHYMSCHEFLRKGLDFWFGAAA